MAPTLEAQSAVASPLRSFWVRMITTNLVLTGAMVGAVLVARTAGWRLPTFVALPVFLTLNGVLQPQHPGAPRRPLIQRFAFTALVAGIAGVLLWFLEVSTL